MPRARVPTDRQRFWRLLRIMAVIAVLGIVGALAWLRLAGAPLNWPFALAVAAGIAGSVLLAGVLMGLVFLSDRSGHDARVGEDD